MVRSSQFFEQWVKQHVVHAGRRGQRDSLAQHARQPRPSRRCCVFFDWVFSLAALTGVRARVRHWIVAGAGPKKSSAVTITPYRHITDFIWLD